MKTITGIACIGIMATLASGSTRRRRLCRRWCSWFYCGTRDKAKSSEDYSWNISTTAQPCWDGVEELFQCRGDYYRPLVNTRYSRHIPNNSCTGACCEIESVELYGKFYGYKDSCSEYFKRERNVRRAKPLKRKDFLAKDFGTQRNLDTRSIKRELLRQVLAEAQQKQNISFTLPNGTKKQLYRFYTPLLCDDSCDAVIDCIEASVGWQLEPTLTAGDLPQPIFKPSSQLIGAIYQFMAENDMFAANIMEHEKARDLFHTDAVVTREFLSLYQERGLSEFELKRLLTETRNIHARKGNDKFEEVRYSSDHEFNEYVGTHDEYNRVSRKIYQMYSAKDYAKFWNRWEARKTDHQYWTKIRCGMLLDMMECEDWEKLIAASKTRS